MRLKLFGFPDESPHAIPGPDDFCITKMMWLGLMELTVSRGISHQCPKMVYRSGVRPSTQRSTTVLSQQSHKNWKRCGRMESKCSQKKTEWVYLSVKEKTDKRTKFAKRFCFFLPVTQIRGNTFKFFFFLLGSLWFPPSLTSFNWINEQVQPDLRNIYLMHIRCFAGSLIVQLMLELLLILLSHLKRKKFDLFFFLKKEKFREKQKKSQLNCFNCCVCRR